MEENVQLAREFMLLTNEHMVAMERKMELIAKQASCLGVGAEGTEAAADSRQPGGGVRGVAYSQEVPVEQRGPKTNWRNVKWCLYLL